MRLPIGSNFGVLSRVGERLRAAIPSVRGEQKAIAFRAGVTPEALNKILTGKTQEPGFETVARIARAAGINLDDLYDGEISRAASVAADFISAADRRKFGEITRWLQSRFSVDDEELPNSGDGAEARVSPAPSAEVPRGSLYAPAPARSPNVSTKRARKSNVRS